MITEQHKFLIFDVMMAINDMSWVVSHTLSTIHSMNSMKLIKLDRELVDLYTNLDNFITMVYSDYPLTGRANKLTEMYFTNIIPIWKSIKELLDDFPGFFSKDSLNQFDKIPELTIIWNINN
jgi:hypothetical protein